MSATDEGEAGASPAEAPESDVVVVPTFARDFPKEPRLAALVRAFVRGDYARVKREGRALARETESEEVRRAAAELVRRTRPDPLMVWLLVLAGLLLAALSGYWIARAG